MVVSRNEVIANVQEMQKTRQERMEELLAQIVPEIDKKLLSLPEDKFPTSYQITEYTTEWPELGAVLVELYQGVGWRAEKTYYRESLDSYGDGRGNQRDYVRFHLD